MLKNRITLYIIFTVVVFLNSNVAFSQLSKIFKDEKHRYTTVGFGGGSSHYFGDLSPYTKFYYAMYSNVRWNGTINYQHHFNQKVSARVGFSYVRIFGNDATYGWSMANSDRNIVYQRLRNLHFRNDLMEFTLSGIYTFMPLDERRHKNQKLRWSPYAGVGVGLVGHDPKARNSIYNKVTKKYRFDDDGVLYTQPWVSLKSLSNEGQGANGIKAYSSITPVFPVVVGVKAKLNENWILSLEGGLRLTLTDYLDDVGNNHYTNGELSFRADEDYYALTGKPRYHDFREWLGTTSEIYPSTSSTSLSLIDRLSSLRGSKRKDSYIVTQITLNYIISNRVKCPPLKQ